MEFSTNYKRIWHSNPEVNDGPVLVETDGYLTTEQLVNLMIKEGQELRLARAELVDFQSAEEINVDQPIDPTRAPGFDLADFANLAASIKPIPDASQAPAAGGGTADEAPKEGAVEEKA